MDTPILDSIKTAAKHAIEQASEKIWSVYALNNESRKEIYFGVSKRLVERIREEHAAGKTKTIRGWNWSSEKIYTDLIFTKLDQSTASKNAHVLEKYYEDEIPGYKVHKTAGI